MDKNKLEEYKRQLAEIEDHLTDDVLKQLTKDEIEEYVVLIAKIKARLEILENF